MSASVSVLAVMGRAAGLLDCVTPQRELKAAQDLLDAAAAVAELIEKSRALADSIRYTPLGVGQLKNLSALDAALARIGGVK